MLKEEQIPTSPDVPFIQYLNCEGELSTQANSIPLATDSKALIMLYQQMLRTRLFDQKAIKLQRTGLLGTYPSTYGQEAIAVAMGTAMQAEDIFAPYYREHGTLLMRGVSMTAIYQYWGGDERGSLYPNNSHDFPTCIPIASQCLHGAGAAFAIKHHQQQRAVVTTLGDGATSKGDFYEAMNVAGCWQLPLVFVINNNQWAISVPRERQTATPTLAQKAMAAAVDCVQVDGNDIIAMTAVLEQVLTQARNQHKPFVIEALTYRLGDHTTADDASRYCDAKALATALTEEPLIRLKNYLQTLNAWNESQDQALQIELQQEVETAVEAYLKIPPPENTAMFDFMYETTPAHLILQRQSLIEEQLNE